LVKKEADLMVIEIGITAGEIWHYLDTHGWVSLNQMSKDIDRSKDAILMSLGWLAREGHIILNQEGIDYKITLRR
jgi:hypothetical protein